MPVSSRGSVMLSSEPDYLRPYAFHGVNLEIRGPQAIGDCPFCGREAKFTAHVDTGLWRCLVCASGTPAGGGNGLVFTRLIYETALAYSGRTSAATVATDRGYLSSAPLTAWGAACAPHSLLLPGYGLAQADANPGNTLARLDQVYRQARILDNGEWTTRLLPTPGIWPDGKVHALHLPITDFDASRPNLIICEGPWDGMALWEVWDHTALDTNIIAVPGCNVWRDEWTELCKDKHVILLYDSDHPREYTPGRISRSGYDGMARVAKRLSGTAASVRYIRWGPDGYDPARPTGWDVRDHLTSDRADESTRRAYLSDLLSKLEDAPREWFNPASPIINGQPHHVASIEAIPCSSWTICEDAWKDAMRWRQDMSDALAVLLAVCASTQQSGNQLFLQLVGSAGSGKTTMCDGLLVSGHCHSLEHLTGFHSGWKLPDDPTKDCSLIARINGKTLITPEADVLLQPPLQRVNGTAAPNLRRKEWRNLQEYRQGYYLLWPAHPLDHGRNKAYDGPRPVAPGRPFPAVHYPGPSGG